MKVGKLVQRWHDTGAMGHVPIFGVVSRDMPRTFDVTWEYGRVSRVRKAKPTGVGPVKAYNLETAREVLASKGVDVAAIAHGEMVP